MTPHCPAGLCLATVAWMGILSLHAAPPADWKLAFSDEFDGTQLDAAKWSTTMQFAGTHGPRYHNESYLSYTLDEDVLVGEGLRRLRTDRRIVSGSEPIGLFNYSQGLVST